MKRIATLVLSASLVGCQSTGYQEYALAMARIAEAQASVAREQSIAMMTLARDPNAGETTRTVAVLMLALGVQTNKASVQIQPPQNEALQWAQVLLPTVATLGLGYWGYRTAVTQSNNQAQTTQASYAAFTAFKPTPIDFSKFPVTNDSHNITTTTTQTRITNDDGVIAVGANPTASQDNSTRPVTPIVPVVVVPPVVPIVPVITGGP
jgi:hypothetical protein